VVGLGPSRLGVISFIALSRPLTTLPSWRAVALAASLLRARSTLHLGAELGPGRPGTPEAKRVKEPSTFRIMSRMLGVDLDGSRRIEPAHVECPAGLDGSRRIGWMIIGMIKAHPTKNQPDGLLHSEGRAGLRRDDPTQRNDRLLPLRGQQHQKYPLT
jgi:hypothetical protein